MNNHTTSASSAYDNCIHRAGWVVKDPWTIVRNGYVLVESGKIRETGTWGKKPPSKGSAPVFDHGPGALLPALVNAHTHLELSCFKEKITCEKGFSSWVRDLLDLREKSNAAEMSAGAKLGLCQILETGTGAICEISSLGLTAEIIADSGVYGVWCREMLGNLASGLDAEPTKLSENITASLAAHAPHTTSPELMTYIKHAADQHHRPFSLHLSESNEEIEFITTGQGPWADFLLSRGIDHSCWGLPAHSPVAYMDALGILDEKTIAVHLLQADEADLDILAQRRVNVCLCPRSNQALHGRLPKIPAMLAGGICLCLGTDSLASAPSLDLFDEMAFVAANFDSVEPARILAMATINGARAVGLLETLGEISEGKDANLVYVPVETSKPSTLVRSIVTRAFNQPVRPLSPLNTTLNESDN